MKSLSLLIVIVVSVMTARADSPLTSTSFYTSYLGIPEVKAASEAGGVLNSDLMDFLKAKKPVAHKMAVINALGWSFEGQSNYQLFKDYLGNKTGKGKRKAENLLALAYLKALDNYFDCRGALALADEALSLNPKSYTFNIIHGLIKAQVLFDSNWCDVYNATNSVRTNSELTMDMNNGAIQVIFTYMDLYKADCE